MVVPIQVDLYDVVSAGADWLTCTAKSSENALRMERFADAEAARQRALGSKLEPQRRSGFEGWSMDHIFFGRREHDVMLQLSGPLASELSRKAIAIASNVSRFDLQVTVWTGGSEVEIALNEWQRFKALPCGVGRPRSFSLTINHPAGQTFYINKRVSDNYGRIYDKGVESKLGPPGLLWRYEVELKRDFAKRTSAAYALSQQPGNYSAGFVRTWMTSRGVLPTWDVIGCEADPQRHIADVDRDVLTWFSSSLRITVGKAVVQYGLSAVLESLGLLKDVSIIQRSRHGN